jgi:hypothetical protein
MPFNHLKSISSLFTTTHFVSLEKAGKVLISRHASLLREDKQQANLSKVHYSLSPPLPGKIIRYSILLTSFVRSLR